MAQRATAEHVTDAQAIARSLTEPSAFEALFDRHFPAIHRYVHRRVGPHLADDLAAETFMIAFGARDRYDRSRSDARPWLYGIAANLLRHYRRTERRQLMAYARTGVDTVTHPDLEAVDARVDAGASASRLAAALAALADADRETLLLLAWADLTYEEIAQALEVPVGTVRSRLNRARNRIRELMGEIGQSPGDGHRSKGGPSDG